MTLNCSSILIENNNMTKFHKQKLYKQIRRNLIDSCHNNPNRKLAEYLYGFVAKFNAIKNRY